MDERHLRSRKARQLCPDVGRVRGDRLVVDGDENFLEDHDSPLELATGAKMRPISGGGQTSNLPLPRASQGFRCRPQLSASNAHIRAAIIRLPGLSPSVLET